MYMTFLIVCPTVFCKGMGLVYFYTYFMYFFLPVVCSENGGRYYSNDSSKIGVDVIRSTNGLLKSPVNPLWVSVCLSLVNPLWVSLCFSLVNPLWVSVCVSLVNPLWVSVCLSLVNPLCVSVC